MGKKDNMDPIQMDDNTAGRKNTNSKKFFRCPEICLKIGRCLVDNRLETGGSDIKDKLREINSNTDEKNQCLKKKLNIIFLTTGVALFLAVIVVIIYTSIGKEGTRPDDIMKFNERNAKKKESATNEEDDHLHMNNNKSMVPGDYLADNTTSKPLIFQ